MPRQNTIVAPTPPCLALVVIRTQYSASRGRPAMAGLRSRTAIRSVAAAIRPMPAAASSTIPGVLGTGGSKKRSARPWLTRDDR